MSSSLPSAFCGSIPLSVPEPWVVRRRFPGVGRKRERGGGC